MPHHRDAVIELGTLEQLSRAKLRALWTKELAEKPPASLGRDILALGIAYARQERLYGGLPKPVAKELDRLPTYCLADDAVHIGPVSGPNSLLTGNLTGNFSIWGLFRR
jgi:hypothetical protein